MGETSIQANGRDRPINRRYQYVDKWGGKKRLLHRVNFLGGSAGKEPASRCRRHGFDPWVGKIPWRKKRQPAPVFLPGKFHRQRNYSPQEWTWLRVQCTRMHACTCTHTHYHRSTVLGKSWTQLRGTHTHTLSLSLSLSLYQRSTKDGSYKRSQRKQEWYQRNLSQGYNS